MRQTKLVSTLWLSALCCLSFVKDAVLAQEKGAAPVINVLEPSDKQTLKPGDTLGVRWQVSNPPSDRQDWDLFVDLHDCGMGNFRIYSASFDQDPGKLDWVLTRPKMTPAMSRAETEDSRVRVCMYNRRRGNDELFAMAMNCKAAVGPSDDWLACGYSRGSVKVDPTRKVELKRGHVSTTLEGSVKWGYPDIYVLRAKEGQVMTVALTSGKVGIELEESNDSWPRTSLFCGPERRYEKRKNTFWKGILPRSGDYKLIVSTDEKIATSYALAVGFSKQGEIPSLTPEEKMAACGSVETGKILEAKEIQGLCISLPESLYPEENTQFIFHGANAQRFAPCACHVGDCWGGRYGFHGDGFVEIKAKSAQAGIPDYRIVVKMSGFDLDHPPPLPIQDLEIHLLAKSEPLTEGKYIRISGEGYARVNATSYYHWKSSTPPYSEIELPVGSCSKILANPIPVNKEMIIVGRGRALYGKVAGEPFGKFKLDIVSACRLSTK